MTTMIERLNKDRGEWVEWQDCVVSYSVNGVSLTPAEYMIWMKLLEIEKRLLALTENPNE